mgnify:CR=1 FL=1
MQGHLNSKTWFYPTSPSGEAPSTPLSSSHKPVCSTGRPVFVLQSLLFIVCSPLDSFHARQIIFKGSRVSIREDFSERVNAKRKELLPKLQEARKEGKIAYLSYDKLVIRHSTRSSSNMNYGLAHLGCNQANSPPFLPPFSQSVRPSFPHHPVYVPQHVQQTIPITTLQHSEEQNELNPSQNFVNTNEWTKS